MSKYPIRFRTVVPRPKKAAPPAPIWKKVLRIVAFLGTAGILVLPFSALLDWFKQEMPLPVTQLSCEVPKVKDGDQPPRLDPSQPIVIAIKEQLVCGVEQYREGGDYIVWKGGGNGYQTFSGPMHPRQELGLLEQLRQLLIEPSTSQFTACSTEIEPYAESTFPRCRHVFTFTAAGQHSIAVRIVKRGDPHVEEFALPVNVAESSTVLKLSRLELVPPSNISINERSAPISASVEGRPIRLGPIPLGGGIDVSVARDSRSILVFPLKPDEQIVDSKVDVQSSNGAKVTLQSKPDGLYAQIELQAIGRAWLNANVLAHVRSSVPVKSIEVGSFSIRSRGSRQIYNQPVLEGTKMRIQYAGGASEELNMGETSTKAPDGFSLLFERTSDGVVVQARQIAN